MFRQLTFCLLIGAGANALAADETHTEGLDSLAYLNGYTAARVLAERYEGAERQAFLAGMAAAADAADDQDITDEEARAARMSWFGHPDLSPRDKASYTSGYLGGESTKDSDFMFSPYIFVQGMLDSLQNSGARYIGQVEGQAIVNEYQRKQFYRKKREAFEEMRANERLGSEFLAGNSTREDVTETDSGLQYKVIRNGAGTSPDREDTVVVMVQGWHIDTEVFVDSRADGAENPVRIRVDQSLPGWREALPLMSPGSVWELYLPAQLAYGDAGWQDRVSPGQTVIYRLELLEVVSSD